MSKTTNTAHAFAVSFATGLRQKRKIMRPPNLANWTTHFKKLQSHYTDQRIQKVMNWYLAHVGEDMIPAAYAASSFAAKFRQIEVLIGDTLYAERTSKKKRVENNDARRIFQVYKKKNWVGGGYGLAEMIEDSWNNYLQFFHKFNTTLERLKESHGQMFERYPNLSSRPSNIQDVYARNEYILRVMQRLRSLLFLHPTHFISNWCEELWHCTNNWKGFDGDLKSLSWKLSLRIADKQIFKVISDYGADLNFKVILDLMESN